MSDGRLNGWVAFVVVVLSERPPDLLWTGVYAITEEGYITWGIQVLNPVVLVKIDQSENCGHEIPFSNFPRPKMKMHSW